MGKRAVVNIGPFVFAFLLAGGGCVTADYVGQPSGDEGSDVGSQGTADSLDDGSDEPEPTSDDSDDQVSTGENDSATTQKPTDSGGPGSDDEPGSDTEKPQDSDSESQIDTGSDDPTCGDVGQPCCTTEIPCDGASMVCVTGYPGENDAYCWQTCDLVGCSTVEAEAGYCYPTTEPGLTYCAPASGELPTTTCTSLYDCPGSSDCLVAGGDTNGYCFETGCDPISTCLAGRWCAPLQNGAGACVDTF